MSKYVSPFNGVKRIKVEDPKFVNAYALPKGKNRGGLLGAGGYLAGNVVTGAGQMVEGIVDVGMAGADLLRGDTDMAQYRFLKNVTKEWDEELERSYNPGTVMQIGGDVASGIGTSLMYMIPKAGIFLGAAGTFGSNVSEAAEKTGEVGLKELGYAAAATVPEVALEGLLGAATRGGKALFSAGSKALTKGTAKAGVKTVGKTATKVSKSLLGHVALETAKGMAGEGAEEAITEAIDPFLLRLFKIDENAQLDMSNVLYAGLIGSLSGGLMTSGPAAINYKSSQAAGRMIREAGLTDAFLDETRELLGGADRAKTKAEAVKGEKVAAAEGSGVIGKVTAMGKNTVNTVRQSKIASSAKRIAETTRKNLQSFEQFNAKENKTAQEQAIADAMLGELRGNVYLLETSYLSETYEQAILDATPEQKQDIVDFINESMAAKNAAKSDYTVADLDADTDGILTSMAAKYVEGDLERYMGIRRVDSMEGRGRKATETAEEAAQGTKDTTAEQVATQEENGGTEATEAEAPDPWESVEGIEGFGTQNKQEEDLLRAASTWGVPKRTVPAMLKSFREGTDLTPSEFAEAWGDGVMFFGRLGLNESAIDKDSPLARVGENARRASIQEGKTIADEELKRAKEKADKKKMPARNQADAKRKQEGRGDIVKGKGLIVKDLDPAQYAAYKAAETFAAVLGTDIVIETDLKTDTGKQINGFYSTKTNRMHININAKRDGQSIALYTLGHEVTHYIKEWSPEKFKALSDFVMEHLGNKAPGLIAAKAEFLRKMPDYKDYTVTQLNDLAAEEVVADSMELVLSDGKILDELAHTEKTVWQKIKDFITKIIADIRKYYGELNQASKTAQVLKETVDSLDDIEQLFYEGVTEAGERTRTAGVDVTISGDGDIIYAIGDETTKKASELSEADLLIMLESAQYGEFDDGTYIPIRRNTPEFYIEVVRDHSKGKVMVQNYPMAATVEHLRQNMEEVDGRSYGKKRPHELSPDEIVTISRKMGDPAYIVLQQNGRYAEVVSYYDSKKKKEVVVSIDIADSNSTPPKNFKHSSYMNGYNGGYYNIIVTQHELDDLRSYLDGTTVVYDKKKTNGTYQVGSGRVVTVTHDTPFVEDIVPQPSKKVNRKFSISEEIPSTLSAEDQRLLFDDDFYERYENESREPITETVEELEAAKASEAFATMSDDEAFDLNAKLKAKRAGYDTVYDYYVETEKERMGEEYRRYVQTGRSNRTSRTLEEKRKKAQKERTLRSDVDSATPLQNAQYQIIQETNPMWDEYHTGIRSPKEIKTFAEVAEDPDSFTWGDFTREDAQKALRDGTVRVYSSYAIKNGVFVSTSYKQALQYAGNNPDGVHTRVVALDSVAWINGDEGQYAKVYKDDGIRYSIDETPETPDVSENATDTNVGGTEEELTDRDMLLAMAERLVGNEKENEILTRYKEQQEAQLRREDKLDSIYDEVDEQRGILYTDPDAAKRSAAAKRLKELFKDVDKISSEIAEVDRELTKIAGMKIMRNLIVRERKTSKKIYQEWYHQMYTRNKETRETTDMRRQVRRIYGRVSRLMFAPTRTKSVPYELKPVIAEALKMADMDGEAIARLGELEQQLARLEREAVRDEDKIAKKKREIENQEKKVGKMKEQTELMIKIFEKSKEIKDGVGAAVYDEGAMNLLKGLQAKMGNASIRNANKEQLQALKDFYDVMYHRINTANNTFASQRAENIDDIGSQSTEQVKTTKALKFLSPRAMELAGLAGVRGFFWKNMKPLTVFDALGSDKFRELFQKVLDGEIVWATDVEEASKVINETRAKYGHAKWKQDKRVPVQTKDGEVKLSLAERMSLYAYFQRLQAMNHLEFGGFKLDPTATDMGKGRVIKFVDMKRSLNDAQAYRLDKELAGKISATLTAEQKAYVEEVQKYLTEMGKKGNEVSRKLYGMDIFTEEFYFPIKVVSDVLQSQTGKTGDPKIKNQGMTKELVQDAKEPMLLQGFDDVMVEHINNMATYHAFVLPVEDLTRVLNYKPANFKRDKDGNVILNDNGLPVSDPDAQKDFTSLKAVIQAKYGVDAVNYIEQLLRDLNGGARRDAAATILDKGLTAFKRAATTMSASTIIQQPTSVIRAMAYVDAKHFTGASITPWETVKKYAKVAFIKEMGGFDTGTGARTQEFLNQREYDNIGQKVKAAVTPEVYGGDPQARAEFFGWLTSKADEKTWCFLFGAVVNEQAERLGKPKDSEEVLKAAGERFTEVVRRTQVYDSTLTRNQYMRSKDGLMKMATSFMAEPTTVVSMAADAIIRLERGDKMFIRKTAAGIAGSIILNAMAVSLIYAMRDDDEEKNYLEKYISSLTGEIVEGLNPLEYFPILRDIMSLFKGYEIERSDMTLINNLLEQVEMITSSKRSFMDKMIGVTGAVAAFFGIPVTNLYRDVKGLTTTTISLFNGEPMTAKGTASAALEGVTDQFGLFKKLLGGDRGTSYELYRAKVSGDKSHYDRVAARYDSPEAEEQALRRELRENDKRIGEAAEARRSGDIEVYKSLVEQITDEGIFDRGMVIRAIQTEMNALSRETEKGTVVPKDTEVADEETVEVVSLYSSSDLNAALERGDTEDFKEILDSMISDRVQAGKTEAQAKSAVKSSITAYWKPRYIEARNANDTETMKKILQILLSSGLYGSRNDVAVMLEGWIKAYAKSK